MPSPKVLLPRFTEISTDTKFYLRTDLCCYPCPLQSHWLTLIGGCEEAMSVTVSQNDRKKEERQKTRGNTPWPLKTRGLHCWTNHFQAVGDEARKISLKQKGRTGEEASNARGKLPWGSQSKRSPVNWKKVRIKIRSYWTRISVRGVVSSQEMEIEQLVHSTAEDLTGGSRKKLQGMMMQVSLQTEI